MKKMKTLAIYQDRNMVVMLVAKGEELPMMKHLRSRMNLGKKMMKEKWAVMEQAIWPSWAESICKDDTRWSGITQTVGGHKKRKEREY
jgi:hypothetical protein